MIYQLYKRYIKKGFFSTISVTQTILQSIILSTREPGPGLLPDSDYI